MRRELRRVVVTGIGAVTPLGGSAKQSWTRLIRGSTATSYDEELGFVVARVPQIELQDGRKWTKAQSVPVIQYAILAAEEALADAAWPPSSGNHNPERTGVAIGTGIGASTAEVKAAIEAMQSPRGVRALSPYFVPRLLLNMAAGHVSMAFDLRGPNHSVTTACATGSHSIGDAARFISFGDADVMVAGGSESSIDEISLTGFSRMRALSTSFALDSPETASRPFDKNRDGFVMGEGAGIVVLEEREHAIARGAKIYAEITGYGLSSDAAHISAPASDGRGARACMKSALDQAGRVSVDYVNAHATSTPLGDAIESRAISSVVDGATVSSFKGAMGHLLGAAGAVEAVFTIMALHNDIAPGSANIEELSEDCACAEIIQQTKGMEINAALTNSFGFGGTNVSLLFEKHG